MDVGDRLLIGLALNSIDRLTGGRLIKVANFGPLGTGMPSGPMVVLGAATSFIEAGWQPSPPLDSWSLDSGCLNHR